MSWTPRRCCFREIIIANEIVGRQKLERIIALCEAAEVSFGVNAPCQIEDAEAVFADRGVIAEVLVEIEVGENRSGVIKEADFLVFWKRWAAVPTFISRASFPTMETATMLPPGRLRRPSP